jgi:hypothetical protein
MRIPLLIGLSAASLTLAAAEARPAPQPRPVAPSADRLGTPASYRTPAGHGYTPQGRRMLDCLASDHRYDPGADRIRVRPGVTRRCDL